MDMKRNHDQRVLGIVGSPRRGGNTELLVDEVLSGAQEVGAHTTKYILNELNIIPCQACGGCYKSRECVQEDDMKELLGEMDTCIIWVLGTPIYWWGPSGQFKVFLDRWYGVPRTFFEGRRIILTIPLGGSEFYARHTVGILTDIIHYLGMELQSTILAPGVHRRGDIRIHGAVLAMAHQAGWEAVQ